MYRVVAQRTKHVVITIGIPQTCFIVSATVMTFPFIDWEKHIINCHTSRPVPMIDECCIGAVIGLGCIGAIWKKQRMNKFKYNHNIVINIYLKFVKFSYTCLTEESYFLQLCETCKININEIKKTCWLLACSEDHIKYIFPKHHHSKFAIMQIIFVLRDWFH